MTLKIATLGTIAAVALVSTVLALQAPNTANLGLVGDRFKPLTWDQMSPEQKTMTTNLLNGPRRGMGGPRSEEHTSEL